MLHDPRYMIVVGKIDGAVNSFSIAFFPRGESFWLLEYIAVHQDHRNAGVGQALFSDTLRRGRLRSPAAKLLIEVDRPKGGCDTRHESAGPYRFYRRMMCRLVAGLKYVLPLDIDPSPDPMMLLTYSDPPLNEISRAEVQRWLSVIYEQVYQKRRTDSRIAKMLVDAPDSLPCIPL